MTPQKGEKKKKKKKVSNTDTLQEQRKNKKEMEFELKLAKEKEEMYEREKQLKINRLVQEVWKEGKCILPLNTGLCQCGLNILIFTTWIFESWACVEWVCVKNWSLWSDAAWLSLWQVSETEREDLEESEKVQHWVERLCQTRLEQISCVENESPEVQSETSSVRTSLF